MQHFTVLSKYSVYTCLFCKKWYGFLPQMSIFMMVFTLMTISTANTSQPE